MVALLDLADIIKVDFRRSDAKQRADIIKSHGAGRAAFLSEKVETLEEFFEARRLGYHYFQGCFFGEPQIVSTRDVPANKINCLRMMNETVSPRGRYEGGWRSTLS